MCDATGARPRTKRGTTHAERNGAFVVWLKWRVNDDAFRFGKKTKLWDSVNVWSVGEPSGDDASAHCYLLTSRSEQRAASETAGNVPVLLLLVWNKTDDSVIQPVLRPISCERVDALQVHRSCFKSSPGESRQKCSVPIRFLFVPSTLNKYQRRQKKGPILVLFAAIQFISGLRL